MATFGGFVFDLSTFDDLDCLRRLVARTLGNIFDLFDDLVALKNLTKNNMATIEPTSST